MARHTEHLKSMGRTAEQFDDRTEASDVSAVWTMMRRAIRFTSQSRE
jgi:hypothetical protein